MTTKRFILRALLTLLVICALVFGGFVAYYVLTYIDDTITQGEGYGFTIGSSKLEAYTNAGKTFTNMKVYVPNPIDEQGYGPHFLFTFSKSRYDIIANRNRWEFFFSDNYSDFLRLEFQDGKLAEIYRHRQYFELP